MNSAKIVVISNPFAPEVHQFDIPLGKTIRELVGAANGPFVYLNKEQIGEDRFDYLLQEGDELCIFIEPGEVLTILTYVALAIAVASAIYVLTALPDEPEAHDKSPTYNLRGQSNEARLGEAIPVQYGQMRVYPDLLARPWVEYRNNEQYLHQLFCIGKGEFDVSEPRLSDTSLSSFDEVQSEVVYEGPVTLFPSNVETSVEVANQELSTTYTGPFVVNSAGTQINKISVDVVFSEGLYRARSSGDIDPRSSSDEGNLIIDYREIDDAGSPLGSFVTGLTQPLSGKSLSPLHLTYSFSVPPGRYEVRVRRTVNTNGSHKIQNKLQWEGLRGFIVDSLKYPNTTVYALRMRATEQLSGLSSRSFNVLAKRKIPVWNGSTWTAPQLTRSVAWAIADVLRNDDYGSNQPNIIDTDSFEEFDDWCTTNNFYFDGRFDTVTNTWKTIEQIAAVGRGYIVPVFDKIGVRAEVEQTLAAWTFNRANIKNETYQIVYERSIDYDSIEAQYLDEENDYEPDVLPVTVTGTTDFPREIDYRRGITNRTHLYKILKFITSKEKYSNLNLEFDTELEGYLPEKGDLINVASDVIGDLAIAGEVLEYNASGPYLILSNPLTTDQSVQHAVLLRERDGTVNGPHTGSINANNPYRIDLDEALDFDPNPVDGLYNVIAAWGEVDFSFRKFLVTEIDPKSSEEITIRAVNYDARVYDLTGTVPAPTVRPELPRIAETPEVFSIQFENTVYPDRVGISWQADQGWAHFILQWSTDGGSTWTTSTYIFTPYYVLPIAINDPFDLTVRVRAVGLYAGPWKQATLTNAGANDETSPEDNVTGLVDPLAGADYDMETSLTYTWDSNSEIPQYYWRLLDANGGEFTFGYTSGTSVTLSKSQIVACAKAAGRVSGVIGRFEVYPTSYTRNTNFSAGAGVDILNAQMAAPNDVDLAEGFNAFTITTTVTNPPNDFKGMVVYIDTTPGFTPDPTTNLVHIGDFAPVLRIPTQASIGSTLYVRVGLYDEFGVDDISLFGEVALTITKNIESDFVVGQQFGSSIVQNPYFDQARVLPDGTIAPAAWYYRGPDRTEISYLDSDRDKIQIVPSSATASTLISIAFSPNVNGTYELVIRMRSKTGTPTITFGVAEKHSALADGKIAISPFGNSSDDDLEVDTIADATDITNVVVSTSFDEYSHDYIPNSSARYASIFVAAVDNEDIEVDYFFIRETTSGGGREIYYQPDEPVGAALGDYWIDSDDDSMWRLDSTGPDVWLQIKDQDIIDALNAAADAQATADGKIKTFAQASAPTAEGVGDIWMDTDDNNKLYRWSGTNWVPYAQDVADWTKVFGTGKPADYAAPGGAALGGLLFNSWMAIQDVERNRPAGWFISDTNDANAISYQDAAKTIMNIASASDTSVGVQSTAIQVNPNAIFKIEVRLRGNIASLTNGLYIRVMEYDSDLPEGKLFVSRNTVSSAYDAQFNVVRTRERTLTELNGRITENGPVPDVWTSYEILYQPTSTAKWASLCIMNWTAHGLNEIWVDRASIELAPGVLATKDNVAYTEITGTKPPPTATDNGSTINNDGNVAGNMTIISGGRIICGFIDIQGSNQRIVIRDS